MTEPILPWFKRPNRYAQVPQPRSLTEAISFIRTNLNQRTHMDKMLAVIWSDEQFAYLACYASGKVERVGRECAD